MFFIGSKNIQLKFYTLIYLILSVFLASCDSFTNVVLSEPSSSDGNNTGGGTCVDTPLNFSVMDVGLFANGNSVYGYGYSGNTLNTKELVSCGYSIFFVNYRSNPYTSGTYLYGRNNQTGTTELLSKNSNGTPVSVIDASLSSDSKYVNFVSNDYNLNPNANGQLVYRRNIASGVVETVSVMPNTALIYNNATGTTGGQISYAAESADSNYVVFEGNADVYNSGMTGNLIYRKNLTSGAVDVISKRSDGSIDPYGLYSNPQISKDGKTVIYYINNLNNFDSSLPGMPGIVYQNTTQNTQGVVSMSGSLVLSSYSSGDYVLSGNGQFVFFNSVSNSGYMSTYRRDLLSGSLLLVSNNWSMGASGYPKSSSDDGRYLCFTTWAQLAGVNVSGFWGNLAYIKDIQTSAVTLASKGPNGEVPDNGVYSCDIDGSGMNVIFSTNASNLVSPISTQTRIYQRAITW